MTLRLVPLFFGALLAFSSSVCADTVHFKNGGIAEGIVVKKTETYLVLDLGFGTSRIERSEVARVETGSASQHRSLKKQWQKDYFGQGRYVPKRFNDVVEKLRDLEEARSAAVRGQNRIRDLDSRIVDLEKKMAELRRLFRQTNQTLSEAEREADPAGYNRIVTQSNQVRAKILVCQEDLRLAGDQVSQGNPKLNGYVEALSKFEKYLRKRRRKARAKGLKPKETEFLTQVTNRFREIKADFRHTEVTVSPGTGEHVILPVTVNGATIGRFLLDTGASSVTFSQAFADRLRMDVSEIEPVHVTLANGGRVPAKPVVLRSVKVGNAEVRDVRAIVMHDPPGPGVDGLLGMTFLSHFVLRLDSRNNKIVLKEFVDQ